MFRKPVQFAAVAAVIAVAGCASSSASSATSSASATLTAPQYRDRSLQVSARPNLVASDVTLSKPLVAARTVTTTITCKNIDPRTLKVTQAPGGAPSGVARLVLGSLSCAGTKLTASFGQAAAAGTYTFKVTGRPSSSDVAADSAILQVTVGASGVSVQSFSLVPGAPVNGSNHSDVSISDGTLTMCTAASCSSFAAYLPVVVVKPSAGLAASGNVLVPGGSTLAPGSHQVEITGTVDGDVTASESFVLEVSAGS